MTDGPPDEMLRICYYLNATLDEETNFCFVDCNCKKQLPPVEVVINDRSFPIYPNDYVIPFNSTHCALAFYPYQIKDYEYVFLGDTFLGNVYTIHDYGNKRVGFAEPVRSLCSRTC